MKNARTFVTVAMLTLLACSAAHAAGTAEQQCQASKQSSSAKYIAVVLGCASKAAKAGTAIDDECLANAATTLGAAFTAAHDGTPNSVIRRPARGSSVSPCINGSPT